MKIKILLNREQLSGYFLLELKGICLDFSNSFFSPQFTSQKTEKRSSRVKIKGERASLLI